MKRKLKRLLSCFLSLLMIAGSLLGSPDVWAETVQLPDGSYGELITAEDVFGRHQVLSQSGYKHFLMYDGVPKADDFCYWEYDGKRYPAYCISPTKPGATELGSYDVNVKELTPNPKLYWILRNGYPYNSPEDLGVSDDDEAYAATKFALWTSLNGWDMSKWTVNPNCTVPGDHSDILTAMQKILDAARDDEVLGVPLYNVSIIPETETAIIDSVDPNYYSQTFYFQYDERIEPFSVRLTMKNSTLPGAKIVKNDSTNTEASYFDITEKFKIMFPKDEVDNADYPINVAAAAGIRSWMRPAMQAYAINLDASKKNAQDYLFSTPEAWEQKVEVTANVESPSLPYIPKLVIQKDDEGTPLAGAVFSVTDEQGTEYGPVTTATNGKAELQLPKEGRFTVIETKAPDGYKLDSTPYVVTVQSGQTGEVTLNVSNSQKGSLQVRKVDAVTGEALENATFRITSPSGAVNDYTTDSTGTIVINDAEVGNYSIEEIIAPDGYQIAVGETHGVVEYGKMTTVVIKDNANPGVRLTKLDEETKEPLAGATFELYKQGNLIASGTTDHRGVLEFLDLEPGWFTVRESSAPDGYIANTQEQNVQLEANKIVELTFLNQRKPSLTLLKVDDQTNEPLAGAIIEVKYSDGSFVGQGNCGRGPGIYRSDAAGKIELSNLPDGASVVVRELEAPEGYLLDDTPNIIKLEAGKEYTYTLRNVPRPGLYLRKVDAETGEPILGAKFQISKPDVPGSAQTYMTNDQGVIFLPEQDVTALVIEEIAAAPGYILNSEPITVQLEPGKRKDIVIKNTSKPGLRIIKVDQNGAPVSGVVIKVSRADGSVVGEYTTDGTGVIYIPNMESGTFNIQEISAPPQFEMDNTVHRVTLKEGKIAEITLRNELRPTLRIVKTDSITKGPLEGVTFEVRVTDGQKIGDFVTSENGEILIPNLQSGTNYTICEIATLPGYILDKTPKQVTLEENKITTVQFENKPKSPIYILKLDSETGQGIPGVRFRVTKADGSLIGEVTTDAAGRATLPNAPKGYITVQETFVPEGYVLDPTPQTKLADGENPVEFTFYNKPYGAILIKKLNASTQNPLAGAMFKVTTADGTLIGDRYTSGPDGTVLVSGLEPDKSYIVTETRAPDGFLISDEPRTVTVKPGDIVEVVFENKRIEDFTIRKVGSDGKPIAGVTFRISTLAGEEIAVVTTGADGLAVLTGIEPGSYKVQEISVPDGVLLNPTPQTIEVKAGESASLTFVNDYIAGLKIIKTVEQTGEPLEGVTFHIEKPDGGLIGEYTTDENGEIFIPLKPQTVVVREVAVPDGIQLDPTPQTVEIKANDVTKLPLKNIRLSEFTIYKTDADGKPLAGAVFELRTTDGQLVTTVTSGENGLAIVPNLEGDFIVTEVRSPDGYILDPTPYPVHIEAGKPEQITIENDAIAGLKIIKTVEQTGEPLEGVTFRIEKPDGGLIGEYTTNNQGEIFVSLEPQTVVVQEVAVPDGIQLDPTPHTVEIKANDVTKLPLKNERLNGVRIRKVDADTGKGIYGVRIMITDEDNDVVGVYTTDQRGYIELDKTLPDGIYYLEEISAAPGYDLDKVVKRIHIENGKTKTIVWENAREKGQIQILKTSADANPITGQPAGTRLEGAVFEIARADTDLVVGYMVSDYRGVAASDPLPLGRYVVREVTPPPLFQLNDKEFEVELKVQNDVVRVEVQDSSAQISTSVKKSGNTAVIPGQQMRYDFSDICNLSNVPLDSFFWHDELPSAVRLDVIHTGTWNQPGLSYSVTYRTNRNSSYRTLASGLLATQSYDLDCSATKLGLAQDEYVTDFRFEFGTVQPGFREQDKPMILVTVLPSLTNGARFANRTDAGGSYYGKWFSSSFTWVTEVSAPQLEYPKTGY